MFVSSVRQLFMSLSNKLLGVESLKLRRYAILELFLMISSNDFSKKMLLDEFLEFLVFLILFHFSHPIFYELNI